jgi:hypothetical protein
MIAAEIAKRGLIVLQIADPDQRFLMPFHVTAAVL